MATTRTAGITIDRIGRRTIKQEYRGVRVFLRLGTVCQEHAERRLAQEIERLEWESGAMGACATAVLGLLQPLHRGIGVQTHKGYGRRG